MQNGTIQSTPSTKKKDKIAEDKLAESKLTKFCT